MHRIIGRKSNVVKSNLPSCCRAPRSRWRVSLTSLGTPQCSSHLAGILTTLPTPRGSSVPRLKVMTSNYHLLRLARTLLLSGKDSCQGDSGGPLVGVSSKYSDSVNKRWGCLESWSWLIWGHILCRYAWLGIVSFGVGCAEEGYPGAYTRTQCFLGFVAEQFGLKVAFNFYF